MSTAAPVAYDPQQQNGIVTHRKHSSIRTQRHGTNPNSIEEFMLTPGRCHAGNNARPHFRMGLVGDLLACACCTALCDCLCGCFGCGGRTRAPAGGGGVVVA